jgi:sterol desaturase/sphingolipid hydroxylase (fatty acid hydroxylase superfamily)
MQSFVLGPMKALLLAAAVFIPFERLATAEPAQRVLRRGWATDAITGLLNGLLLFLVLLAALGGVDAVAAGSVPHLRAWIASWPLFAQVALAIVIGDLGVYATHRLAHAMPSLWRFHAVHHSAEELDWLVALRMHAVDLLLARIGSLGPLVALNVSPPAIAVFIAVFGWQSWLVHANVRLSYGPLRWLLVSPDFHHWHHCADREAHDRNYASILACWDVLFGTLHLPAGRRPLRYGVDEHVPAGYLERFIHPFRRRDPAPALEVSEPSQTGTAIRML